MSFQVEITGSCRMKLGASSFARPLVATPVVPRSKVFLSRSKAQGASSSIVRSLTTAAPASILLRKQIRCNSVMGFVNDSVPEEEVAPLTQKRAVTPAGLKGTVKIYSMEGTNSDLDLLMSFLDADGNEVAPIDTSEFKRYTWEVLSDGGRDTLGVYWEGPLELPAGTRDDIVVMRIKPGSKTEKEYINQVEIRASDFYCKLSPNSWIHRNNGARIFFSTKLALLPQDTPEDLKLWRQADLDEIKGSGVSKKMMRLDWDRVYDYDVYNDLAPADEDRPILGGNEKFPYPRRIRTGRSRVKGINGQTYESRSKKIFVPLNERFNTRKEVNFTAYGLLAKVPNIVQNLRVKLFDKDGLDSFAEVDQVYSKLADPSVTVDDGEGADTVERPWWLKVPILSAVLGSVLNVRKQAGSLAGMLRFPPPAVWHNREDKWRTDEEWGRQALAGVNPCCIQALTSTAQLGGITETHLSPHLEGHSLQSLLSQATTSPRLLLIDHTAVFEDYAERISRLEGRYGYSGRAVLYRRNDDMWVPVALELKGGMGEKDVYTPSDHPNLWLLAKGVFNSIDAGFHQLVTHWLRTHACTEPYIISTRRNLSMMHPVYQLMVPHFVYTMQINSNARLRLIACSNVIEDIFTPGEYGIRMSSEVYKALWRFDKEALPEDLISRGLATREGGAFKMLLKDYPYGDDGMLMWNAIEKWVGGYLKLYYDDNTPGRRITDDSEITAWWNEILTVGHADKKEGWPDFRTVDDLTRILTTMIWMVSCHHAAINFSQYPYAGYAPNRPSKTGKPIPKRGSPEYKELVNDGEKVYCQSLVELECLLRNAVTTMILSTHADNEVYIGEPTHLYITDKRALELYSVFVDEVKGIEATILARNKDPTRKMRTTGLPYTSLDPTSKSGITNRGVPQSVTI